MEEALIASWHKLKAAMDEIEAALGFVPGDDGGTVVTADSGSNGPPPGHN